MSFQGGVKSFDKILSTQIWVFPNESHTFSNPKVLAALKLQSVMQSDVNYKAIRNPFKCYAINLKRSKTFCHPPFQRRQGGCA